MELAAEMGCDSFHVHVTAGEMLAADMDKQARTEFALRCQDLGVALSATCGDFGLNFGDEEAVKEKEALATEAIV